MAAMAGAPLSADGLDVWAALVSGAESPRTEVPVNVDKSRLAKVCTLQSFASSVPVPPEIPIDQFLSGVGHPSLAFPHPLEANYSALIQGNWKLINGFHGFYDGYWSNNPYMHTETDFFTQGPVKVNGETTYLFDLSKDPEERHNVAAEHVDVVLRMQARLVELADHANGYR